MSAPVPKLQKLLGPAVFIGWPRGSKGTKRQWGHLTLADMTPEYLAKLASGNIGTSQKHAANARKNSPVASDVPKSAGGGV
jgi:hypothetical protein